MFNNVFNNRRDIVIYLFNHCLGILNLPPNFTKILFLFNFKGNLEISKEYHEKFKFSFECNN